MTETMITTNQRFHSSVNIAFDFNDSDKVSSFIPTASASRLIENLFMSVAPDASSRAKVLIGAYGRGKSHIVLMTLALLYKKDNRIFKDFFSNIAKTLPRFSSFVEEYVGDKRRLLPIVITGNSSSLAQSFLQALYTALRNEGLSNLMPSTNTQGVIDTIELWRKDYPDTFDKFSNQIDTSVEDFIISLRNFSPDAYKEFIEVYPSLTSGGVFNSLAGLDILEVYDSAVANIKEAGFDGIYVVYDEFSKYLETNIAVANVSDVKLLQDFAEKCNRSGRDQMHLLLVCHKDISNYIDGKLPKERVDGWRGVSGRFEHIEIRNGFAQSYELIESSILKNKTAWQAFAKKNDKSLRFLEERIVASNLIDKDSVETVVLGCYPLHPVTTFLLPRISERVAQNERTLFTYLTSNEKNSLGEAYSKIEKDALGFVTPDNLYDYFEPLFRKEVYTSEIHSLYELTSRILARFDNSTLEAKIIKTLMLIYAVSQFECLAPTAAQIIDAFTGMDTTAKDVESAIDRLIREDAVVYLRRSNGFLKLKESSGIDIEEEINRYLERNRGSVSVANVLNELTAGSALYPSRHNDKREIVRFFQCNYLASDDFWEIRDNGEYGDESAINGKLFAVLPYDRDDLAEINDSVATLSKRLPEAVFAVPKKYRDINDVIKRYKAVSELREAARDDSLLEDEYDVFMEDYSEVISVLHAGYFQPEQKAAMYYHDGKVVKMRRRAQLSELLSSICDEAYPRTPVINNEAIVKNELSPAAVHSRTKILAGLCAPLLSPNLGLQGNGQECSIMRSVFSVTGIINNLDSSPEINLNPDDNNITYVFDTIREFIYSNGDNKTLFDLYRMLTSSAKGIGLKRGLVILFLNIVLREDWNNLLLLREKEEQRLTVGVLNDIDCYPEKYTVKPIAWTPEKAEFVQGIKLLYADYLPEMGSKGDFTQAVDAISRWYLSLPRFAKTATRIYNGTFNQESYISIPPACLGLSKALKRPEINPRGFLFEELPRIFECEVVSASLLKEIGDAKRLMDKYVDITSERMAEDLRSYFGAKAHPDASLASIVKEWCEGFESRLYEHVFSGTTNRIFSALQSFTADEDSSLKRLFKAVTSLRIEDWDEKTVVFFIGEMTKSKNDIEKYAEAGLEDKDTSLLRISYIDDCGNTETRSFRPMQYSPRAKLLKNEVENALEEMGQAITDSEKRQVLFDVLRGMC